MQIPLPTRFHHKPVIIFASLFFLIQQAQGTELSFSLICVLYITIFTISFNVAGGLAYPSGAFIFFNGMLTCLVGLLYKAFLGEAAQTLLLSPDKTMGVYCAGMFGLGAVAFACRRLLPKSGVLSGWVPQAHLPRVAVGCFMLGTALSLFGALLPPRLGSALAQLNYFNEMAILLSTYYEVRSSDGIRSSNWVTWVSGSEIFAMGIFSFSKEAMFTPIFAWLLPCILLRFNFSARQLMGLACAVGFSLFYLVPYSQYGRTKFIYDASFSANAETSLELMSNLGDTRRRYVASISSLSDYTDVPKYYQGDQGLFDRLQMLSFDDALIHETDDRGVIGMYPTYLDYVNLIPHVFYPDKPSVRWGNVYAHEIGLLARNDDSTGVSFSPTADAYHQARWKGVLLLLPGAAFLLFIFNDWISGDVGRSPWGLILIAIFAHSAPEGLLIRTIYLTLYGPILMLVVATAAGRVFPIIMALFVKRKERHNDYVLGHSRVIPGTGVQLPSELNDRSRHEST